MAIEAKAADIQLDYFAMEGILKKILRREYQVPFKTIDPKLRQEMHEAEGNLCKLYEKWINQE